MHIDWNAFVLVLVTGIIVHVITVMSLKHCIETAVKVGFNEGYDTAVENVAEEGLEAIQHFVEQKKTDARFFTNSRKG